MAGLGKITVLLTVAITLLMARPLRAQQTQPSTPAADQAWQELNQLLEQAPARQVGQPGNDVIDRLVADRFTEAARANNDPERWKKAQDLVAEADKADALATEVRSGSKVSALHAQGPAPWYMWLIYLFVEGAPLLIAFLVILGVVSLVAAKLQRRKLPLVVGILCLVLAAGELVVGGTLWLISAMASKASKPAAAAGASVPAASQSPAEQLAAAVKAMEADKAAGEALKGLWQNGRVKYWTAVFVPGKAALKLGEGKEVRVYQMAPNLVDPGNLPAGGISAQLVYAGRAQSDELTGKHFQKNVAVVDFDCARRWLDTVQLGAAAVLVLEPREGTDATFDEAAQKLVLAPVTIPRFFLRRADLAAALGADWEMALKAEPAVTLTQEPGRWERRQVAADWLFIPGSAVPAGEKAIIEDDPGRQLVLIQAYKDARSIVPEISPGANSAANLVLLLRMIDSFHQHQPLRPVLLCAVNDHGNALAGEQEFDWASFVDPGAALKEIKVVESELAVERAKAEIYQDAPTPQSIEGMRSAELFVGGRTLEEKEAIVDRLTQDRNMERDERARVQIVLDEDEKRVKHGESPKLDAAKTAAAQARVAFLDTDSQELTDLLRLFNQFGERVHFDKLAATQQARVVKLFGEVAAHASHSAERLEQTRDLVLSNMAIRRRLAFLQKPVADKPATDDAAFVRQYAPVPATVGLALDLSFGTRQLGFFHYDATIPPGGDTVQITPEVTQRLQELGDSALREAYRYAHETGKPELLADTISNAGGTAWQTFLGGHFALGGRALLQFQVPELTLTSIYDSRPHEFTPSDTPAWLDAGNFKANMGFALEFLPRLVSSQDLVARSAALGVPQPLSVQISVRKEDQFAIKAPKTPLPDAMVVAYQNLAVLPPHTDMYGQVSPVAVMRADDLGVAWLRGSMWRNATLTTLGYDKDFAHITDATDLGNEGEARFSSVTSVDKSVYFLTQTIMGYSFNKTDLIGLSEPLTLIPAQNLDIIDAQQDSMPLHFGAVGPGTASLPAMTSVPHLIPSRAGVASIFIQPGQGFKLRVGSGLAINVNPLHPQGAGFDSDTTPMLSNVVLQSGQDLSTLTEGRLALLESKGVTNGTASTFETNAQAQLKQALADEQAGKNARAMVEAEEFRGLAYQAYTRGLSTLNDLVKAVVLFLALVIPFCFFVTKLISPWTDINRQLAMFGCVFLVMAAALRFLHPAFAVARTPEVVILAFVILGLATFVAAIVMGRFNTSMTQAVEESQLTESVEASQGRLAGVAFLVGVNNMKRRRIRTSLTCATVVLVTFTMLSVISVGQDVEPATQRLGPGSAYDGFVFTRAGSGAIDPNQLRRLRAHYEGEGRLTVARVWAQRMGEFNAYLPWELTPTTPVPNAAAATLSTKVLLGLEVAENGFTGPLPIQTGGRWFTSDDAREVVLSVKAAELLGITPENMANRTIELGGLRLKLVGLLDDEALKAMNDLANLPLLPYQAKASELAMPTAATDDPNSNLGSGEISQDVIRTVDVAFVPIGLARSLGDADYRSLSVKYLNPGDQPSTSARAWKEANELIQYQQSRVSVGLVAPVQPSEPGGRTVAAGEYTLTSTTTTEVHNILNVAIPIILAATIILNTMLGSVMERRREVAIYNAIGLNPGHVMMFFLAESLVFGLVGSVAGYLLGQVLALIVTRFHLELNLNYSSLSVMVVIFLSIGTVLLSTLYPAMMAARAAVPSGQRRWSLPQPHGDEIFVQFPFSYDGSRVLGVCAYLREFMRQNSEASTGKFLATLGPVGRVPGAGAGAGGETSGVGSGGAGGAASGGGGGWAYAMVFDVAPAPFDLGVNQKMEVYAYYDERVKAHMLSVYLTRISGESGNWLTVNQPFLEALRKRLLGWRSQRAQTHEAFYREGRLLFENAPVLPVASAPNKNSKGPGSPGSPGSPGHVQERV